MVRLLVLIAVGGLVLFGAGTVGAQKPIAEAVAPSELVLGRGPIHEAFADVVTFDPTAGIVAPRKPPEPIQELPPETRPAGARVLWIPGYWAWDDERTDFIWVSGGWRNIPPGRRWIPGYWSEVSDGYQWIPGFWEGESTEHIEYLPTPPVSLEEGPNSRAPSTDLFWVPGCWVWRQSSYAWRPGFWWRTSPGWIWIPAHHRYTPLGIVFVGGYWDYDLARRGRLYAPVYYPHGIYVQAGYTYRPTSLVELGLLSASLFIHPKHHHYYYGDYYAPRYSDRGYHPSYRYESAYRGYDPLFSYYTWQHRHRNDLDWPARVEREFIRRRDQPNLRPPRVVETGDAIRHRVGKPIVQPSAENAVNDGGAAGIQPRASTLERLEQMRDLRRERQEAEQRRRPDNAKSTTVVPQRVHDQVKRLPTQSPNLLEDTTRPRAEKSHVDVPRWHIPKRGFPTVPAASEGQIQVPAKPQPSNQGSSAAQKSGPRSRLRNTKPSTEKE